MWIICLADDSHEMSSVIFSENTTKKNQYAIMMPIFRANVGS